MAITFPVSNVERAMAALPRDESKHAVRETIYSLLGSRVEAFGVSATPTLTISEHPLVSAAHVSFAQHYPLVLTPDAIWLAIAQGFAAHLNANAERLRVQFVKQERREPIRVRRSRFERGSTENPWHDVLPEISDAIAREIGRKRDLMVCDFSTTGACERAASEIALMDVVPRFFSYELLTLCGIPEVTLEGTVDDWVSVRRRAAVLMEYELDWWAGALLPVLDRLVDTANGRIDKVFWRSLYKENDESGGPYMNGWINVLFPYVLSGYDSLVPNEWVEHWADGMSDPVGGGARKAALPLGISKVPFLWRCVGEDTAMELLGGFLGVAQDPETLALRPALGWAVRETGEAVSLVPPLVLSEFDSAGFPDADKRFRGVGVAMVAGRASAAVGISFTQAATVAARIQRIAEISGVRVECALSQDFTRLAERLADVEVLAKLVVGVPIAYVGAPDELSPPIKDLRGALVEAAAIPDEIWADIDDIVPGGVTPTNEVHLVCFGPSAGILAFGSPSRALFNPRVCSGNSMGVLGANVAEVSHQGNDHAVVDASAAAHEARVVEALDAGVNAGDAAYYLVAWDGDVEEP